MPVKPEFIINLKGKQFVLLAGLLDLAHQQGLRSIETEVMAELCQPEEKRFVVRAIGTFRTGDGEGAVWSAHGDGDPTNTQMRGAELRHAETRAIARMLRFATNVALTAFEELGPDSEAPQNGRGHQHAPEPRPAAQRARHDPEDTAARKAAQEPAAVAMCAVCGEPVDERTAEVSRRKFAGEVLCVSDGKARLAGEREPSAVLQGA